MAYLVIRKKRKNFTVAGNDKFKETVSINSVESSMNSHALWITLYSPDR